MSETRVKRGGRGDRARRVRRDLNYDEMCPVCYEILVKPYTAEPCQHIFCRWCLCHLNAVPSPENDKRRRVLCPLCRTHIKSCEFQKELDQKLQRIFPQTYAKRNKTLTELGEKNELPGGELHWLILTIGIPVFLYLFLLVFSCAVFVNMINIICQLIYFLLWWTFYKSPLRAFNLVCKCLGIPLSVPVPNLQNCSCHLRTDTSN